MPCLPWFSYVNLLTCTNTDTDKTVPQIFTWLSCWLNDMCFWSFVLYSPRSLGGVPAGPYNFSSSFLSSTLPINSDEAQKMWMWENRMWSNCLFVISLIHLKFSDILNSGIYLDLATKWQLLLFLKLQVWSQESLASLWLWSLLNLQMKLRVFTSTKLNHKTRLTDNKLFSIFQCRFILTFIG